jgi:hypothetical protein
MAIKIVLLQIEWSAIPMSIESSLAQRNHTLVSREFADRLEITGQTIGTSIWLNPNNRINALMAPSNFDGVLTGFSTDSNGERGRYATFPCTIKDRVELREQVLIVEVRVSVEKFNRHELPTSRIAYVTNCLRRGSDKVF